jgi:biopolymer transport protein TolR
MGAIMQNPKNGRGKYRPMAEINVTPFVDVMLVLLIIFMVTAPLLVVGVPVDLPQTTAKALPQDQEPLAVTVAKDGKLYLQDTEVAPEALVPRLKAIAESNPDVRIYVRADQSISYGQVTQVLGTLNSAGFPHVALVTAAPKQ